MSSTGQNQANVPQAQMDGPPYRVTTVATFGGYPTPSVDDPICGVFIAFFLASAIFNMAIYIRNRGRGHKFLFSAVLFGFSIARIVACSLRIVVGSKPHQVNTVIASQVFNSAGVVMIFVINLFFAQRILRAYHPRLAFGAGFRAGTSYVTRPITDPAWFHHKACFYIVNFAIEIIVVYSYALSRFDRRFFIPNGSSGPGDYSRIEEVPIPLGDQSADFSLRSQDGLSIRDVQLQKVRNVGA
ncbi:hypothetical protein NW757_009712 [Fusarium falciforme]|nr:hypothetical protein NW757_009712 [Fusarium falciforme]